MKNVPIADENDEDNDDVTEEEDDDIYTLAIESLQDEVLDNEGVDADNEGVENEGGVTIEDYELPPDRKVYFLQHPPNSN